MTRALLEKGGRGRGSWTLRVGCDPKQTALHNAADKKRELIEGEVGMLIEEGEIGVLVEGGEMGVLIEGGEM
eukprot:364957-Chlamydomonas_euryale.AAC.1